MTVIHWHETVKTDFNWVRSLAEYLASMKIPSPNDIFLFNYSLLYAKKQDKPC